MKRLLFIMILLQSYVLLSAQIGDSTLVYTVDQTDSLVQAQAIELPRLPTSAFIQPLTVPSPQTEAMRRFDDSAVDLYTGRISLEIPLVHINDKDFDFPISIKYDSRGFKPGEPDNMVGRNWALNCGGLVSREVNGIPDEMSAYDVGNASADYVKGFLAMSGHKDHFSKGYIAANIEADPYEFRYRYSSSVNVSTILGVDDGRIEVTPDTYYFNVGGISGKFMMGLDGQITSITTSGIECTVDLSNYTMVSSTQPYNSVIRIKADDGYIYEFGGNGYSSMEYTALSWEREFPLLYDYSQAPKAHWITAYYLTKIIAPSGRELRIYYRDIDQSYHINPGNLILEANRYDSVAQLQYSYMERAHYSFSNLIGYMQEPVPPPGVLQGVLTKTAMIAHIQTDSWRVDFYYSKRGNLPAVSSQKRFCSYCGAKLDSVVYSETGSTPIETSKLEYIYESGDRMFLRSVSNSRDGKYTFTYNQIYDHYPNDPTRTISNMTTNIDHWGYWRGHGTSGHLFPLFATKEETPNNWDDYTTLSADREATGKNVEATLLREVVFPTGGRCRYEYEPNYWAYCHIFSTYYCVPMWDTAKKGQKELSGGARIKSIKYYDKGGVSPIKQKDFKYDYLPEGEINFKPNYIYVPSFWGDCPDEKKDKGKEKCWVFNSVYRNSDGVNYRPSNYDLTAYVKVGEYYRDFSDSVSFWKISTFTSQRSVGDQYPTIMGKDPGAFCYHKGGFLDFPVDGDDYQQRLNVNLGMRPERSGMSRYGRILSEEYYSSDNVLLRKDEYVYETKDRDFVYNIYLPSIPFVGSRVALYEHVRKEWFSKFQMKEKRVTEYFPTGMVNDVQKYNYNLDGYLLSESLSRNGKMFYDTEYFYSHKYYVPADKKVYAISDVGTKLIYQEKYDSYQRRENLWNVSSVKYGYGDAFTGSVQYLQYDDYGNPCFVRTQDGRQIVYVWGYYGQKLMARIENVDYQDAVKVLTNSPSEFSSASTDSAFAVLEMLRSALPDSHITTYSYFGDGTVKSITGPSGQTAGCKYDNANRLIRETLTNDFGVPYVVRTNDYNIINQ